MTPELSHQERVRLSLQHQATDRVPIAMVCAGINPPARLELEQYLARERGTTIADFLDPLIDIKSVGPAYVGPRLEAGTDYWGVHREPVSYGAGSYNEISLHPLGLAASAADVHAYPWPTVEWFDYSVIPEQTRSVQRREPYCLMVSNGNIFETAWYLRGFEQIFLDLSLQPDLADALFAHVCDFFVAHFTRILEHADGHIDLVFTADDIAGQHGLLMSPNLWERHIKPHHERLNRLIHEFGPRVIYHSDGAVMAAVPGLLDMGIDVLQALQFDADGMDAGELKRLYGSRLCFQGGISVQRTLPFGTPEDVRQEVRDRIDVLGNHGGYILGPSHAVQAGTPPENIVAMFDTAATHPVPSS